MVNPPVLKVKSEWSGIDNGAPLQASEEKMVLEVIAEKLKDGQRAFMDLVLVVDISGSMGWEGKLDKVKLVLTGILTGKWPTETRDPWVRDGDHICIVTFSDHARTLLPMEPVNHTKNDKRVKDIVMGMKAERNTNMQEGLEEALRQIEGQKNLVTSKFHTTAIILLSDGFESQGSNAKSVDVSGVLVDTIGFGTKHDVQVLTDISAKSAGGVYNNAWDHSTTLVMALSPQLEYLKHIVAKDLELKVSVLRGPVVQSVQTFPTIRYLHDDSRYRFWVPFKLAPATGRDGVREEVLKYHLSYKPMIGPLRGTTQEIEQPVTAERTQRAARARPRALTGDDVVAVPKAVRTEETRRNHLEMIRDVKSQADKDEFGKAKATLADGLDILEKLLRLTNSQVSKRAINDMCCELEGLLDAVESRDMYNTGGGKCYVAACISSHECQRYVARGDAGCRVRLFATDRTNEYLGQAIQMHDA